MSDSRTARALLPALIVLAAAAGLIVLIVLVGRDPVIESVTPRTIRAGGQVEVRGRFFGTEVESVFLAGRRVPVSSISEWEDDRILFEAARDAQSGLLVIENDRGRSDGVLVQIQGSTPRVGRAGGRAPVIASLSAEEVTVGSLLTITGANFGSLRRTSTVTFSSDDGCFSCGGRLFFGAWSDQEIQLRVPAGIGDGVIRVTTPDGISNAVPVSVVYPLGRVERVGRTEIGLQYALSIADVTLVDNPGGIAARRLAVRLPRPADSPLQRSVRYVEDDRADFMFEGVSTGFERHLVRTVLVERFGARTRILAGDLSESNEQQTAFVAFYTRDLPGLDLQSDDVRAAAATIRTAGRTPAQIAALVYDFTLTALTPVLGQPGTAASALQAGYADHTGYSNLMVALLRTLGVPARVVTGVLTPDSRLTYVHSWVEYFMPAIGWVPADPYLGDGAYLTRGELVEDPVSFYFGNLDPMRVAFSRGYDDYDPAVLTGISLRPDQPFSQQALFARADEAVSTAAFELKPPRAIGVFRLD